MSKAGKIAIVTLFGNSNYGNKLQNYALQVLLEKRGFECRTIVVRKTPLREPVKLFIRKVRAWAGNKSCARYVTLSAFTKRAIKTEYYYSQTGLIGSEIKDRFDLFAAGSDQVWNPVVMGEELRNYLLKFADDRQKLCIAPSLGTSQIPAERREIMKNAWEGFDYLSCREKDGAELISEITGRECTVLADPTLVLDDFFWREFEAPVSFTQKYIFMFFLGAVDRELRALINQKAEKEGLFVIEVSNPESKNYAVDPTEFVALIDNAELVLTDSFHVTAFSINLNRQFYTYDRQQLTRRDMNIGMQSRIKSLLERYDLSERFLTEPVLPELPMYNRVAIMKHLSHDRRVFNDYLDKCLEGK